MKEIKQRNLKTKKNPSNKNENFNIFYWNLLFFHLF